MQPERAFEIICEIEPPTRPDLKHVRHQIGVLSKISGAFLIPDGCSWVDVVNRGSTVVMVLCDHSDVTVSASCSLCRGTTPSATSASSSC